MTDAARTLRGHRRARRAGAPGPYERVVASAEPLGREQAAEAVGVPCIPRSSTSTGSSTTGCSTSSTAGCPGAPGRGGRPAKLYRRSAREFAVSFPPGTTTSPADPRRRGRPGRRWRRPGQRVERSSATGGIPRRREPTSCRGARRAGRGRSCPGSGTNRARRRAGCAWSTAPSTPSRGSTPPWSAGSTAPSSRGCSTPWDAPTSRPASRPPPRAVLRDGPPGVAPRRPRRFSALRRYAGVHSGAGPAAG